MEQVKVTLKKSVIGSTKSQKSTVRCLGLKKLGQCVMVNLNPAVQGQLNKVQHLIAVEPQGVEPQGVEPQQAVQPQGE